MNTQKTLEALLQTIERLKAQLDGSPNSNKRKRVFEIYRKGDFKNAKRIQKNI